MKNQRTLEQIHGHAKAHTMRRRLRVAQKNVWSDSKYRARRIQKFHAQLLASKGKDYEERYGKVKAAKIKRVQRAAQQRRRQREKELREQVLKQLESINTFTPTQHKRKPAGINSLA